MILGIISDIHIYNETSFQETIEYLKIHLAHHKPDIMICLGDVFDKVTTFIQMGEKFKTECYALFPDWIFIYGNHDGEYPAYGEEVGYSHFLKTFPLAQARITIQNQGFITLADMDQRSNHLKFLKENAQPNDIILSHNHLPRELVEELSKRGIPLMLSGHTHIMRCLTSKNGKLKQCSMPTFRIGCMNDMPGCLTYITIEQNKVTNIMCQETPLPSLLPLGTNYLRQFPYDDYALKATTDDTFQWLFHPPLQEGEYKWIGGYSRLQLYKDDSLLWDKSYGHSHFDSTPLFLFEHQGQKKMLVSGTWGKSGNSKDHDSAVLINALNGEVLLYIPTIGITAQPYLYEDKMYVVDQWHVVLCIDLTLNKVVWSQVAFVSHPVYTWRDNRPGGGWCINSPFVKNHVWVVNLRGDVILYCKETGTRKLIYPACIKKNSSVAYSPNLFCGNVSIEYADPAQEIIKIENQLFHEPSGQKLSLESL